MAKRTASARKQVRSGVKRALRNKSLKSAIKTGVVKARKAIHDGAEDLKEITIGAISGLDRAASKGALHKNNAARRKSRLTKALNAVLNPPADGETAEAKAPAKTPVKATPAKAAAKTAAKKPAAKKAAAKAKPAATKKAPTRK